MLGMRAFCHRLFLQLLVGMACLAAVAVHAAPGLTGTYYNNRTLTAPEVLVRTDSTVNFNWGNGSPSSAVNADSFSVRWTGYVRVAVSGNYQFQTNSDDGVRLSVNGSQIINNWTDHSTTTDTSANVALTAGVDHPITLDFYENWGDAVVSLLWKRPGDTSFSVIPALSGGQGLQTSTSAIKLASYSFQESAYAGAAGELKDNAGHPAGPFHGRAQGSPLPTPATFAPALSGDIGTCGYARLPGPTTNGGSFTITGLPLASTAGGQATVAFWMYWDGTDTVIAVGWNAYVVGMTGGWIGFNTNNSDVWGSSSAGLANGWHHVVAVFTNGGVTSNQLYIDGVAKGLAQRVGSPNAANAVIGSTLNIGAYSASTSYRLTGRIDEVRVYQGAVTSADAAALYAETQPCNTGTPTPTASWLFDEAGWAGNSAEVRDSTGSMHAQAAGLGATLPTTASATPAIGGSTGTCGYGVFNRSNKDHVLLPSGFANLGATSSFTVTAWIRSTDVSQSGQRIFIDDANGHGNTTVGYILSLGDRGSGKLNFFSRATTIGDETVTGAVISNNTWYFVAFGIDFSTKTKFIRVMNSSGTVLSEVTTTYTAASIGSDGGQASIGGEINAALGGENTSAFGFAGNIDEVRVFSSALSAAEQGLVRALTRTCPQLGPHRLVIEHASGTGLTCTPSSVTVRACQDAACSSAYTNGVTGTLSATGGSVVWPAGASFSIAAGSSTTTVSLQATTTTATLLGTSSSTPAASSATTCNFGAPSCTFSAADAGFLFDVPNHVSETAQTVSVSAVRKSDNSTACTPAFASTSKAVTFTCGYTNPGSGTLPVRVGGAALNAGGSSAAACDTTGSAVSLAFNASGVASTTVQYADVGQMLLSARYAGAAGGSEAGLVMTGSDSFIAAPDSFSIGGITTGPIKAGSSFAATVTARNSANATTPNHGRESSAEGATLGWVRIQPTGSGAVGGSFSGSLGAFSGGSASASNLAWTEVGRGDLVARGSNSAGYLGSGLQVFGASPATGARHCAVEGGNCVLPAGTTATVYYGENATYAAKTGQTGTVACTNGNFGDPLPGTVKRCAYVATAATNGSVGDFIPHRFSVAASHACGSFSYAGQPIATTVTAQNAAGNTTVNFNGTATTAPAFAQAVTLADANNLGLGTLAGNSIAATAFNAGVASAAPSYAFTSKTTAPQSLVLRASNGASGTALVSSQGYAEPSMPLRSGRLRLSNAFGTAAAALQLTAVTEYWGGNAWLLNSADNCTSLAGASVALSNPRSATGAASTATSSAGALAISSGSGRITLAAPSPAGSSLSLDVAVNLGSGTADQSCHANHPTTTGAGKAWLQAQNGSCAGTADRDPAARASFGIFSPETRKTVHVREIF